MNRIEKPDDHDDQDEEAKPKAGRKRKGDDGKKNFNIRTSSTVVAKIDELDDWNAEKDLTFYGRQLNRDIVYNTIILALYDLESGGKFDFESAKQDGVLETLVRHGSPLLVDDINQSPAAWKRIAQYYISTAREVGRGRPSLIKPKSNGATETEVTKPKNLPPLKPKANGAANKTLPKLEPKAEVIKMEKPAETAQPAFDPSASWSMTAGGAQFNLPPSLIPKYPVLGGDESHETGGAAGKK